MDWSNPAAYQLPARLPFAEMNMFFFPPVAYFLILFTGVDKNQVDVQVRGGGGDRRVPGALRGHGR